MKEYFNKCIPYGRYYNEHHGLPVRSDKFFVSDKDRELVNTSLRLGKMIMFPVHIDEMNIKHMGIKLYHLIIHGILYDGRRVTTIVRGITPHILLQVPEDVVNRGRFITKIRGDISDELNNMGTPGIDMTSLLNIEEVVGKPFDRYSPELLYLKLTFGSTIERKHINNKLISDGYTTACNDVGGGYFRKYFAENNIKIHNWYILNGVTQFVKNFGAKMDLVTEIDIRNFKQYNIEVHNVSNSEYNYEILSHKQKMRVLAWDIETCKDTFGEVPFPEHKDAKIFNIGLCYYDYHSYNPLIKIGLITKECASPRRYYTKAGIPFEDNLVDVQCKDEKELIEAFIMTLKRLNPDFIIGFNDYEYDWPWVLKRANKYNLIAKLGEALDKFYYGSPIDTLAQLYKFKYRNHSIKITAEQTIHQRFLTFSGVICADIRTILRKQDKLENTGLKDFLAHHKLECKDDMPYDELHRRAHIGTPLELAEVNKYCREDADRCQQLFLKNDIIRGMLDKANVTYMSLYDSLMYADGMRVSNMTYNYAYNSGYYINFLRHGESCGKFMGAFVVPPKKGLLNSKATLTEIIQLSKQINEYYIDKYDKIKVGDVVDAYAFAYVIANAPSEWIKQLGKYIKKYIYKVSDILEVEENNLYMDSDTIYGLVKNQLLEDQTVLNQTLKWNDIDYTRELCKVIAVQYVAIPNKYPSTALDFASLYPSIICDKNISPEMSIIDPEVYDKYKTEHKIHEVDVLMSAEGERVRKLWTISHHGEDAKYGIYPRILIDLKKKRGGIKASMKPYAIKKEEMAKIPIEERNVGGKHHQEWIENEFWLQFYDTKQKTIKVLMNTFYGVVGFPSNPSYTVELAGGVTAYGRENLKAVHSYITQKHGCKIWYGDTDSLYFSINHAHFRKLDEEYYTKCINSMDDKTFKEIKLKYSNDIVQTTFDKVPQIKDAVNKFLEERNGTKFLEMAYEEVLFPVIWLGKKKYCGIAHISKINFNVSTLDELFIKGLEIIKKGCSQFSKVVITNLLLSLFDIYNNATVYDSVIECLNNIKSTKWDYDDFIKTGSYKKSPAILLFVKRMMEERGIKYNIGERLEFIICKKPLKYDPITHSKINITTGDKYEPVECVKAEKIEVDLDYYIEHEVIGQLARMLAYMDKFYEGIDLSEDRDDKEIDKEVVKNCKNFLIELFNMGTDVIVNESKARKALKKTVVDIAGSTYTHHIKSKLPIPSTVKYKNKDDLIHIIINQAETDAWKNVLVHASRVYDKLKKSVGGKKDAVSKIHILLCGKNGPQVYHTNKNIYNEEINSTITAINNSVYDIYNKSMDNNIINNCVHNLLESDVLNKSNIVLTKKESEIKTELKKYLSNECVTLDYIENNIVQGCNILNDSISNIQKYYSYLIHYKHKYLILEHVYQMVLQDISGEPSKNIINNILSRKDKGVTEALTNSINGVSDNPWM